MNRAKEVNDADRQAGAAAGPRVLDAEGGLSKGEGRAAAIAARPKPSRARFRLKRTLSPFSASDGALYLLRNGSEEDFVVSDPSPRDLVVLEALAAGFASEAELGRACEREGVGAEGVGRAVAALERIGLVERRSGPDPLPAAQRERYDRQLIYFSDLAAPGEVAEDFQLRLERARVAIVGCGGLGSWTACGLACAGLGELVLLDDDRVEASNLNRQLLFGEADVGKPKIEVARRALLAHNSALRVTTVDRRVRGPGDLADVLEEVDMLIATADWPPYELPRWINEACLAAGTPYITAGQFLPLSRVGPTVIPGRSACLECEERRHRHAYPLYDELAEFRTANPANAATVGAACGAIGSMLAMEAIHLLTGVIQPASLDAALILDLRTMTIAREEVVRDPTCPACGHTRGG